MSAPRLAPKDRDLWWLANNGRSPGPRQSRQAESAPERCRRLVCPSGERAPGSPPLWEVSRVAELRGMATAWSNHQEWSGYRPRHAPLTRSCKYDSQLILTSPGSATQVSALFPPFKVSLPGTPSRPTRLSFPSFPLILSLPDPPERKQQGGHSLQGLRRPEPSEGLEPVTPQMKPIRHPSSGTRQSVSDSS